MKSFLLMILTFLAGIVTGLVLQREQPVALQMRVTMPGLRSIYAVQQILDK